MQFFVPNVPMTMLRNSMFYVVEMWEVGVENSFQRSVYKIVLFSNGVHEILFDSMGDLFGRSRI